MTDKSVGRLLITFFWIGLAICCVVGPLKGLAWETASPAQAPMTLAESLSRAYQLLSEDKPKEAREELAHAQILAGGPCGECLLGLAYVYSSEKDWRQTKENLHQAIPLLKAPALAARAYNLLGTTAFQSQDDHSTQEAEEAFRHAVSLGGTWGTQARFNLAKLLFKTERWAEAAESAQAYLKESEPKGLVADEARIIACQSRGHLPERAASELADTETLHAGGDVTEPEAFFRPRPAYPEKARVAKIRGIVITEVVVDQEGCVADVRALRGLPEGLTESTLRTIRTWVYRPAMRAGKPVRVAFTLTTNFQIQ
jgi:TonB family protein